MKPLFPEVAERLRVVADDREALAAAALTTNAVPHRADAPDPLSPPRSAGRRRTRRPGWRTGTFALVGALLISSGAYAARGLWQPELGIEGSRPVAIAGSPSDRIVDRLAPMRREQTEADRGAESQAALKFSDKNARIRTDFVRLLAPPGTQEPLVLIPIDMRDGTERLCIWVRDRGSAPSNLGGRGCGTPESFLHGQLALGTGDSVDRVAEAPIAAVRRRLFPLEDELRKLEAQGKPIPKGLAARAVALRDELRATTQAAWAKSPPTLRVVGIAPDGVAKVSVGDPAHVVDVVDNAYAFVAPEADLGTMTATWLDERGKRIPWEALGLEPPVPPARMPTPAEAERLAVALATNVDPRFAAEYERFATRIFDACRSMRRDPPVTHDHLIKHTIRQFQNDLDGFDAAKAELLLEVVRGVYCPIRG